MDNTYAVEKYMNIENMFKAKKYQNNYYYSQCDPEELKIRLISLS